MALCRHHFPQSAELHLMAISPEWHRRGIGRAMIHRLVADLRATDCQVLQVKTLGPSRVDEGYAATRAFYQAMGFVPLEEVMTIWPGNPCLVMVMPLRQVSGD